MPEHTLDNGYLAIGVVVDCRRPDDWQSLVPLGVSELVNILVPPRYPLQQPFVFTPHRRFARLPHVVWGDNICLHLAENDWDPGRGMHGLAERLVEWFRTVADGTLAVADPVLEPPITERSRARARLIVRPDLPRHLAADRGPWIAMAVIEAVGGNTYEVRGWLSHGDPLPAAGGAGRRRFLATVLGLPDEVGFSYPRSWGGLVFAIAYQRIGLQDFNAAVQWAAERTDRMWTADERPDARPLTLVLMVSPAPGPRAAPSRAAYLAAWTVETPDRRFRAGKRTDPVVWVPVYDQRPAHTVRRDTTRPVSWLRSRRVLLLGCGGLGGPIAEYCVRAGAAVLHLVDKSVVRPGILVRQPYRSADIGQNKAQVLALNLARVGADTSIQPVDADAVEVIMRPDELPDVDLIVDATAAHTVGAALERTRWERDGPRPPLLSVVVGHDCSLGVATLALAGANGAGNDILRRLAISASDDSMLADVLDEFHPDLPRTERFVPEPGCSDPTYRGSAADLAFFASSLLNEALTILPDDAHPATPQRWAAVVRSPAAATGRGAADRRHWPEPLTSTDTRNHYEVRIDPHAFADVRREVIRMAAERGADVETGGLLLGQIDHAARVAWVTEAQALPAGSTASAEALVLDPAKARDATDDRRFRTRRLVEFIGAWHTHPWAAAWPSDDDERAMAAMAASNGAPVLMVIFGNDGSDRWNRWLGGRGRPDWYARLSFPV
ncbi:ThiF family adenylyltransferase [Actinoplanes sp. ATCC 53533]|uniref:ThiF family adenylyltransferase n=1 Tax=Actinoplanes sp. ATCC 53533 TaxID=1288362 RepID=UPI001F45DB66|nr:ThiF family adenylyltransferase [Actinoplanes sp. ATCC 53533]